MPAVSAPTSVMLKLSLDEKVLEQYRKEASDYGVPLEDVLSNRLGSCVGFTSARPIYLDDQTRQQIEKLAGRNISQPNMLVAMFERLVSMRINGMSIALKPNVLERLRTRHNEGEFGQWLTHQIGILLEQYVGLR